MKERLRAELFNHLEIHGFNVFLNLIKNYSINQFNGLGIFTTFRVSKIKFIGYFRNYF